ncbi:PSD1 and planctomycete cytochrome C domain-containing protein [Rubripirellula reticaptiva]|uniref:Planctomycete cytochrome C n=1 Tax=Rubripirellula reticaptiva TaxID=2528013 RepID=A0A5C6EQQ7_9BACT|nr:PSD1 and planctomycete cytochrome C domain-containing protein [Rubripirellula reticaptiva]TWU51382.1 Planctomycete cytochrome C [Rubripirellula reticaptiva]
MKFVDCPLTLAKLLFVSSVMTWFVMPNVRTAVGQQPTGTANDDPAAHGNVDFNRDIRGILSDKCFLCHGPDDSTREAGLRLDKRDEAIDAGAIVPGDVSESELIARITTDDPDLVMPPPATGKSVNTDELKRLIKWIERDATYDTHWAFKSPVSSGLPTVQNTAWPRNEIDYFVLATLEARGLTPSPTADPATLARRLSLDLTGLPPTPEQLDTITARNNREGRIADYIDVLMNSPHFGERWARWWLDAARYADSAGYEKDMQRQVFFYRDWVIKAMNSDMPYNEFVIQQIAGDLLPGAEQDERVATGFLRNSMTNEEGGADPEQFRVEGMFDRVDAIGKAVLGITTQCAQCHTHKYDPISHREYYQMFASLNDFHEACISVYTPDQAKQRDEILSAICSEEETLRLTISNWKKTVDAWAKQTRASAPTWAAMTPTDIPFEGQKFGVLPDGSIISESYAPTQMENGFSLTTNVGTITAVRLDALTHPQLPRGGPGRSIDGTGALSEFRMRIAPSADGAKPIDVKFVRAHADINAPRRDLKPQYRQRDPSKDDRVVGPIEYAIDGDIKTAWTTDIGPGRSNESRCAIFVPEQPIVIDGEATLTFTMVQKHGGWNSDDNQNFLIGRYRFSITNCPTIPEFAVSPAIEAILQLDSSEWSDRQWDEVFSAWRRMPAQISSENLAFAETESRVEKLWNSHPEVASQLVVQALAEPRKTFVMARGDFLKPSDEVQPAAPAFLNPMIGDNSPDRLRFAKWLVADDSPTTARVIVNRIWQAYFGRGLVTTPEDFGYQSSSPSHPDLLDFLACQLMDSDWSLQHIHRLIVNSATYRQSSSATADQWVDDPVNQWLARGPRFRMEAEMVRDLAMAASGLLETSVGGPSVYPPAPDFLFMPPASYGPKIWNTDTDGNQHRRSLYVHQYRSMPYPPLQVFDAPKGDAACVRRERSNTPLQALVLLNEPQYAEASRALATRVLREASDTQIGEHSDDQAKISLAFRYCTSRFPDATEIQLLVELLGDQRAAFESSENDQLGELIGVDPQLCRQLTGCSAPELAAWIVLARAILNLDETITKS